MERSDATALQRVKRQRHNLLLFGSQGTNPLTSRML